MTSITRRAFAVGSAASLAMASIPYAFGQTAMRVRRNVMDPAAARDVEKLRRVVELMRARNIDPNDTKSYAFLANNHGYKAAMTTQQALVWNKCEHFTTHFLAYHRAACINFERIARLVLADQTFVLPYWDIYTRRTLPPPFRDQYLADGRPNALWSPGRSTDAWIPPVTLTMDWLREPEFFRAQQLIESSPHSYYHRKLNGYMGDPKLAANDPVFWIVHGGVDRMWDRWQRDPSINAGHTDPIDPNWRGRRHQLTWQYALTNGQVLTTTAHGYVYDNWRMG
jgi:tyrosinase